MGENFLIITDRPVGGTERFGWGGVGIFGFGEALSRCLPVGDRDRPGRPPLWYLESLAREAGVRPFLEFLSDEPESGWIVNADGELERAEPRWFTAEEGLATVRGLLDYLTMHPERVAEVRQVTGDLRALEQLLRRLEREGIKWHLEDGSGW